MEQKEKKFLHLLGLILLIGLPGGVALFIFALLGLLFGVPLYAYYTILAAGTGVVLGSILLKCKYLQKGAKRRIVLLLAVILTGSAVYAGYGAYRESIPTVDDRDLLLWKYEPFAKDTLAVTLNEPAALQFDTPALRLDGATALYPVYAAFVQAVYPQGENYDYHPYSGVVDCNGTIHAYERLIHQETDLIFAAAPSQDQLEQAAAAGMQLHLTPIGREAFVFFVNSRNPVTDLTVEQVQGIYTGEITNWKEVGGKFQSIRPFQRAENSGSQSALQRLMAALPLMEPEKEDRIEGMGGIIRQVASYRNFKNAIGFSFRYYSTEMVKNGDIRLLALNGVEPTKDTIRDGSYPISSEFYAVTASPIGQAPPEQTNADLGAFLAWILSEQGQAIIEQTGYVSLR